MEGELLSIYSVSDLHLSFSVDKPMNIFGNKWENYTEKLYENWQKKVSSDDLVVIPGDISWATYLDECYADFDFINKLNGKKVILKGNHDYWWTTLNKMRKYALDNNFDSIEFLQNNTFIYEKYAICGTRGWSLINEGSTELNMKIFDREKQRLILSLEAAMRHKPDEIIVAMHYPPVDLEMVNLDFIDIMKQYNVKTCIYGHLHSYSHNTAVTGNFEGIDLKLVSGDYINFDPVLLKA